MSDKKTVKDETPPPHDEGQFAAVCVDVIDLGLNVETYQAQPPEIKDKTALVFRTEAQRDGKPMHIHQEFTTSLGKKSNMRKFLESWRGKPYTEEEVKKQGIPLDKLENQPCLMTIAHKVSGAGNTYAFIQSIAPLPKQMRDSAPAVTGYTRPDFWTTRKAEYRAAVEAHAAKHPQGGTSTTKAFEDYPEAVDNEGDDSDLPF